MGVERGYGVKAFCSLPREMRALKFRRALNRMSVDPVPVRELRENFDFSAGELAGFLGELRRAGVLEVAAIAARGVGRPGSRPRRVRTSAQQLDRAGLALARAWHWLTQTRETAFERAADLPRPVHSAWPTTLAVRAPARAARARPAAPARAA